MSEDEMGKVARARHAAWIAAHPVENRWRSELEVLAALCAGAAITGMRVRDDEMFGGDARQLEIALEWPGESSRRGMLLLGVGPTRASESGERDWFGEEANEAAADAAYDGDLGIVLYGFDKGGCPELDNAATVPIPAFDTDFFDQEEDTAPVPAPAPSTPLPVWANGRRDERTERGQ